MGQQDTIPISTNWIRCKSFMRYSIIVGYFYISGWNLDTFRENTTSFNFKSDATK